jgi:hypothetical protein
MKKLLVILVGGACTLSFNSCTKEQLAANGITGGGVKNTINIHRVNAYPAGSRLMIDQSADNVQWTMYDSPLPKGDTTLNYIFLAPYSNVYYKWRVTGPLNDSLSSGTTPGRPSSASTTFDINY